MPTRPRKAGSVRYRPAKGEEAAFCRILLFIIADRTRFVSPGRAASQIAREYADIPKIRYAGALPVLRAEKRAIGAAKDRGGRNASMPRGGCSSLWKNSLARSMRYCSLISFASSMISKAYFCLPWASSFL